MPAFTGQLRQNEIFAALFNLIISQQVFSDNIGKHQTLVDKARVDGGLFGDTKLYYATDALESSEWGNDAEAAHLLDLHRPDAPACQAIYIDQFRQISLTIDNYLTKRAFSDEGTFVSFNSVMLQWMRDTKDVYDGTTYNCFVGTATADNTDNPDEVVTYEIDLAADGNSAGENIAARMADLFTEMSDYTRDYNDYGYLRSYSPEKIKVIWNAKYINSIKKIDLPSVFHNEELEKSFVGDVLQPRYFGRALTADDFGAGKVIGTDGAYDATKGTIRALRELTYNNKHYFPGQKLSETGTYIGVVGGLDAKLVYLEDADIIAKVYVKLPPYMSAFEVATSFFNPKSLTENHYLTFSHNTLETLKNYPFVTVKAKSE